MFIERNVMVNLIYVDGSGHKVARPIRNREELVRACNTPENVRNWNEYRTTGDVKKKFALVQVNYNCQAAEGEPLRGIQTVSPFFFYDIDCSDREECRRIMKELVERKDELGLVEVSVSASDGVHAVARRVTGTTILENQVRLSMLTQTEMDTNNKDVSRVVFHGPIDEETTPLLDDALFTEQLSDEEAHEEFLRLKERETRGLEEVPEEAKKSNKHYLPWSEAPLNEKGKMKNPIEREQSQTSLSFAEREEFRHMGKNEKLEGAEQRGDYPDNFEGVPYTRIIAEYWRRTGGIPTIGARNNKLHKLACNLRAICENDEEWLLKVMPRLGLSEQEMKKLVHSACEDATKGSKMMDEIVESEKQKMKNEELDEEDTEEEPYFVIPPLVRRAMAIGLRESLVGVPASMHMPVLCSVLPIAAAYADQVEVEYCDGNMQKLGLMSIIRGEQASGKSVCKNVVDVWKRQFDEEDALARKREEEYRDLRKRRKANEKAPEDPHVLLRMVPVTVSCSTLLKRFKNSGGHTLYSFGEELDTLRKTNGAGSWSSKYDIYRVAFDNGEWGQDYNSDQAESGVVRVAYNWTMLGTDGALRKCFKSDNIENGLSSRVMVAEMPDSSFAKMPKYGKRTEEDDARIQEAVTRLRSCSGFVDTPRLRRAIEQWVEEKRVEAAKDIDRVKDIYRKRAAVIGFRCGVIFHLLSGNKQESKACLAFAVMMADYVLNQQIAAFGETLMKEYVNASDVCQRYGANHSVYDQLPPVFTMDDLRALKGNFCGESALRKIVSRWRRDQWIEKADRHHWRKLPVNSKQQNETS